MLYTALFVPVGHKPFPVTILEVPKIKQYISGFGEMKNDLAVVAVDQDELLGVIWGRAFQPPETGFGYLDPVTPEVSMAVKSDFRNQGLGTRLLGEISERYFLQEIKAISLSVDKRNRALTLYKRTGFKVIVDTGPDYVMRKDL